MIAPMPSAISLNTLIEDLHNFKIARLGPVLSRKLARALMSQVHKKSAAEVTVEDLLTYFPMRYEDRSHPALIRDLHDGVEASLELTVTNAHGYRSEKPAELRTTSTLHLRSLRHRWSNERPRSDRLVVRLGSVAPTTSSSTTPPSSCAAQSSSRLVAGNGKHAATLTS